MKLIDCVFVRTFSTKRRKIQSNTKCTATDVCAFNYGECRWGVWFYCFYRKLPLTGDECQQNDSVNKCNCWIAICCFVINPNRSSWLFHNQLSRNLRYFTRKRVNVFVHLKWSNCHLPSIQQATICFSFLEENVKAEVKASRYSYFYFRTFQAFKGL